MICKSCLNSFEPKNKIQKYCSEKCARRERTRTYRASSKKKCPICGINYILKESNSCKNCRHGNLKTTTLQEIYDRYKDKHKSWAFAHIRKLGRAWNKHISGSPCSKCGYDKHSEICHIRAISDFPNTATLGEVHDNSNVIPLCPNCHWEFDNL